MHETDGQDAELTNDDDIQITDLILDGVPQRRRARRVVALVFKGITTPWIRYSLTGLLILILLIALLPELHPPTFNPGVTPTFASESSIPSLTSADGRVFAQSAHNLLIAFQAATGHNLWQKQLPSAATLSATNLALYCYYVNADTKSATLEALDASSGKIIWQKTLPTSLAMIRGEQPGFILSDDTLYTAAANNTLYALQASDGRQRWSLAVKTVGLPLATILYAQDGIVEVNSPDDNQVSIRRASDGHLIARAIANDEGTPLPIEGPLIYALPGSDAHSIGETIQVFHAPDGALLWSLALPRGIGLVLEQDGVIYLSNTNHSSLTALRGSDGHTLWTYRTSDGAAMVNDFLEQNGVVYLLQQDTTLVSIRVSDGHILWRNRLTDLSELIHNSSLQSLIDQGTLFFYDPSPPGVNTSEAMLLIALRVSDGKILWTSLERLSMLETLTNTLYLLQASGQIDALNETSGQHIWSYHAPTAASIVDNFPGILLLVDKTGHLGALRASDGKPLWYYP